jgi:hypothetical protein
MEQNEEKKQETFDTFDTFGIKVSLEYELKKGMTKGMEYIIARGDQLKKIRKDRVTAIKKKLCLQIREKSSGVVSVACEKTDISRATFYNWKRDDKEFDKEIERIISERNDIAEDILWGLVSLKKHSPSVHYYLDRRHPLYKPRNQTEIVTGDRTYEDLVDEQKAKIKKEQKEYDEKHKQSEAGRTDEPKANTGSVINKKQAGGTGAVQTKTGTEALLGEKDKEKLDTESEAKGDK